MGASAADGGLLTGGPVPPPGSVENICAMTTVSTSAPAPREDEHICISLSGPEDVSSIQMAGGSPEQTQSQEKPAVWSALGECKPIGCQHHVQVLDSLKHTFAELSTKLDGYIPHDGKEPQLPKSEEEDADSSAGKSLHAFMDVSDLRGKSQGEQGPLCQVAEPPAASEATSETRRSSAPARQTSEASWFAAMARELRRSQARAVTTQQDLTEKEMQLAEQRARAARLERQLQEVQGVLTKQLKRKTEMSETLSETAQKLVCSQARAAAAEAALAERDAQLSEERARAAVLERQLADARGMLNHGCSG
eukprot:jgi/Mesvir1/7367/Mv19170-RA.1